jgi:hypothetical protein
MIELQHKHAADCSSERDNSDKWQANKEFGKGGWGGVKSDPWYALEKEKSPWLSAISRFERRRCCDPVIDLNFLRLSSKTEERTVSVLVITTFGFSQSNARSLITMKLFSDCSNADTWAARHIIAHQLRMQAQHRDANLWSEVFDRKIVYAYRNKTARQRVRGAQNSQRIESKFETAQLFRKLVLRSSKAHQNHTKLHFDETQSRKHDVENQDQKNLKAQLPAPRVNNGSARERGSNLWMRTNRLLTMRKSEKNDSKSNAERWGEKWALAISLKARLAQFMIVSMRSGVRIAMNNSDTCDRTS